MTGVGVRTSWRVLASSVPGASHLREGAPCQDAHAWRLTPDGVLVAAWGGAEG